MNITNSNLADAYKIAQAHKAFKKTFNQAPPQTKAFISFMIPLVLGFLIYSFVKTPATQLIVFSIITVIIGGLLYSFTDNYAESWAMSMSFLIITLFWFYIFYNKYQKQQEDDEVGKKTFICEPTGRCYTDGTVGPHDGRKTYFFNPPGIDEKSIGLSGLIPSNQFDVRNSDQFTYMFWLKIDYNKWQEEKFKGRHKIILLKGREISTGDLAVWALPLNDTIQFDVSNPSPVSVGVNFPFGQWVHYTIVVNNSVVELYKNATLEKSAILKEPITLNKTPLYIGKSPQNSDYDNFPGEMLYLTYNNSSLIPSDIYNIYQSEYSNILKMENSNNPLQQRDPEKKCEQECAEEVPNNNFQSMFTSNSEIKKPLKSKKIHLPSERIKETGLKEIGLKNFGI